MRKVKITLIATAIIELDPSNYMGNPTVDQMLQEEIECVEEDPACFLDCDVDHIHIEAELLPGLN